MYRQQKSFSPLNFSLRSLGLAVTFGSFFIASASASIIQSGQANIAGSATVGPNSVSFTNGNTPSVNNTFNVQAPETGAFTGLTGGTINNLSTTALPQNQFITFLTPGGTIFFDLQGFFPGLGTNAACASNAVGSQCTPTNSFFTLTQQTPNSVAITLNGFGQSYMGSASTGSDNTSIGFTTQNLVPGTIPGVLAQVQNGGSTNSYSATINATAPTGTPEPATMFLFGAGLLGVGLVRKFKRAS